MGTKTSRVKMALGLTGQFSWQTMQGLSMAQGRHRPRSMKAVPILIGPRSAKRLRPVRSSRLSGRMAAVGQRWPQAMQVCWQPLVPMRKFSRGVHSPSIPASSRAGWMTLVGQTRMHWPHLMQRVRKASSASAPGGRMRPALRPGPARPPSLRAGAVISPAAAAAMKPRRERSGRGTSPAAETAVW